MMLMTRIFLHSQMRQLCLQYNFAVAEVAQAISDLRDSVDGSSDEDQGIRSENGSASLVPTNTNALVFTRTPIEVCGASCLHLVFEQELAYLSADRAVCIIQATCVSLKSVLHLPLLLAY